MIGEQAKKIFFIKLKHVCFGVLRVRTRRLFKNVYHIVKILKLMFTFSDKQNILDVGNSESSIRPLIADYDLQIHVECNDKQFFVSG
jgi:hypothetical protein